MICSALSDDAIPYSMSKRWFQRLKSGNLNLEHEECPSQPLKVEDEELGQILKENPFCTQLELSEALEVTRQTISKRQTQSFVKKAEN